MDDVHKEVSMRGFSKSSIILQQSGRKKAQLLSLERTHPIPPLNHLFSFPWLFISNFECKTRINLDHDFSF